MDRYFFNLEDGFTMPDDKGVDLTSLPEARREALRQLAALYAVTSEDPGSTHWSVHVTNHAGLSLFRLRLDYSGAAAGAATDVTAGAA